MMKTAGSVESLWTITTTDRHVDIWIQGSTNLQEESWKKTRFKEWSFASVPE